MTEQPPDDDDVIDTGTSRRRARPPSRRHSSTRAGELILLVAAVRSLVVAGHGGDGRGPSSPTSTPAPAATLGPALLQVDRSSGCGTLVDGVFTVACAILNTGGQSLVLDDVRPVLPLGGLQPLGGAADRPPSDAGCPDAVIGKGNILAANSGGCIALTFRPTVRRLAPLPIEVDVAFVSGGHTVTTRLSPFPDLGAVAAAELSGATATS